MDVRIVRIIAADMHLEFALSDVSIISGHDEVNIMFLDCFNAFQLFKSLLPVVSNILFQPSMGELVQFD